MVVAEYVKSQICIWKTGKKTIYTVISHHDGLRALKLFLDKHPKQELSVLVRLAELVITLKTFSFEGKHYQQISGAVMQGNKNGFQLC